MRAPYVYIVTNRPHGVLYCGVTSNLAKRIYEHRTGATDGFTKRYHCTKLVWYEACERMDDAIAREKQIKAGDRRRKLERILAMNPGWEDLYETLNG